MLLREIGIEVPTIVWADDIAIPLATNVAADLVPFLKAVLQQVRGVLRRQGSTLVKASAVLSFRGPGASDLRKEFQVLAKTRGAVPLR